MKPRAKRFWSDEDHEFLVANYGDMPIDDIAKRLGRSPYAVYNRAGRYALGPNRPHDVLLLAHVLEVIGEQGNHARFSSPKYGFIARGMLKATRGKTFRQTAHEWWIREADLIEFLREYPQCVDRDKVQPPYRQYVADRYITLTEAFFRGAAYPTALEYAVKAGAIPEARNHGIPGSRWAVPESILPRLIEGRRRFVTDIDHARLRIGYVQAKRRAKLRAKRITLMREYSRLAQRAG